MEGRKDERALVRMEVIGKKRNKGKEGTSGGKGARNKGSRRGEK